MELTIGNILIMSGVLGIAVVCIVAMQIKPKGKNDENSHDLPSV